MNKKRQPPFASSIRWQSVNVMMQVLLQLTFIFLLARMLAPADFGVMAIALVIVGFVEIFAQVGIGPALIQRAHIDSSHLRTAFSFSLALGIIFFAGMYALAPWIASVYGEPLLTEVLRWVAFSFILSAAAIVPRSILIREMAFKKLFIAALVAMVIGNLIIGLGLAWSGAGIWSYVAALLSQNTLLGLMYWAQKTVPIGWRWDRTALNDMLGYGGRSTVFNMANYSAGKVDTLLVGRLTQTPGTSLHESWTLTGLYDRSSYLMGLPITVLGKLSDSVLFSGMSALQEQRAALQRVVQRAVALIGLLVLPGSVLLVIHASDIAVLFLGNQYVDAGPIVQILFAGVAFRSLIKVGDAAVRALDVLTPAIVIKVGFLLGVSGVSWWSLTTGPGVQGVAWGVTGCTVIQFVAMSRLVVLKTEWTGKAAWKALQPGIHAALYTALGLAVLGQGREYLSTIDTAAPSWAWFIGATAWTAAMALFTAMRHPEIIDGGDAQIRAQWMAFLPGFMTRKTPRR